MTTPAREDRFSTLRVGDSLPEGIKDVEHYPSLVEKLLERGYSEEDLEAIMGGNLMRVWQAVVDHARELDDSAPAPARSG